MTTESIPAPDLAAFRHFCADVEYLDSRWDQVAEAYPDSYVAVYQGEVVAVSRTLDEVLAELDDKAVPRAFTVLQYVSSKPALWIV